MKLSVSIRLLLFIDEIIVYILSVYKWNFYH